jgi:hypothetical protein
LEGEEGKTLSDELGIAFLPGSLEVQRAAALGAPAVLEKSAVFTAGNIPAGGALGACLLPGREVALEVALVAALLLTGANLVPLGSACP